jgi:hypothetical protein
VAAVLVILGSWLALSGLLVSLGLLALRAVSAEPADGWRAFWVGLAVAIAVLQVWHIALPVDLRALGLLGFLAVAGFVAGRLRRAPEAPTGPALRPAALVALALLAIWLADRSLGPPVGDAGLYHLSYVRWASEHALVPGLANLHHRLGFNNPSLLWTAVTNLGGFGTHVSISLLLVAAILRGALGLSRLARGSDPSDVYWALLLAPLVGQAVTLHELRMSSPDPDTAMALVAMAAGGELVRETFHPSRSGAFATATLAILAACLKLSAAPFAILLVGLVLFRNRASLPAIAVAGAALLVPWTLRNVAQTGYPLYPLSIGRLPVDWSVPRAWVDRGAALVHTHFMPPAAWRLAGDGPWLRGWIVWQLTRCPELVLVPALAAAVLLRWARPHRVLWLILPCAGALVLWLDAPAPRFAYAFFWMTVAALGVAAVVHAPESPARRRTLGAVAVVLALLPLAHRIAAWSVAGDRERVAETLFLRPAAGLGFHPVPKAELEPYDTRSGLVVWVPRDGDQVWSAPLPATPEPQQDLVLRRPPGLEGGFAVRPIDSSR